MMLRLMGFLLTLFLAQPVPGHAAMPQNSLVVYTDIKTRQQVESIKDPLATAAINKLKLFMDRSGLPYEIRYTPWTRSLRQVHDSDHALIFQLLRTPDRENSYHWLMPVFEATEGIALITLANGAHAEKLLPDILAGSGLAACEQNTAECTMLEQIGFPQDRIYPVALLDASALEQLLLRGRVDYIAGYLSAVKANIKVAGGDPDLAVSLLTRHQDIVDYLAAPMSIDPDTLAQLKATPLTGLPKLP